MLIPPLTAAGKICGICLRRLLTFILLIFTLSLYAQDSKYNSIRFAGGLSLLNYQDLVHSPFVHNSTSAYHAGFGYERHKKLLHFAEASYQVHSASVTKPYLIEHEGHHHHALPHYFIFMKGAYGLGGSVYAQKNHSILLGGSVEFDLQMARYNFGADNSFGYHLQPSLNIWARYNYAISDKHNLHGRLDVPVMSWLARSPYLVNDDIFIENISSHKGFRTMLAFLGDGKLSTWNKLQKVYAEAGYQYNILDKWSIGASYQWTFIRSTEPRTRISFQQNILLNTTIKF